MKRKALLAVIVACGILDSPLQEVCADPTFDELKVQITENKVSSPPVKACELLKLANLYLTRGSKAPLDSQFIKLVERMDKFVLGTAHSDNLLVGWANDVSSKEFLVNTRIHSGRSIALPLTDEDLSKAGEVLQIAFPYVMKTSDKFVRLNLLFIAQQMSIKTGDGALTKKCHDALNSAFLSCERGTAADDAEFKGVVSVLNSMAYGQIPIVIPDENPINIHLPASTTINPAAYSAEAIKASEQLQLRALKIADKLDPKNQTRRKAHRDLALWYLALGKMDKAEREKQILFGLVGLYDDRILYPMSVGAGNYLWWTPRSEVACAACGRG